MSIRDIKLYDNSNMFGVLSNFGNQIEEALNIGNLLNPPKEFSSVRNIIVSGLGGSAIGGDLLRSYLNYEIKVPIFINRNYKLPSFADENTLVIVSSYSGNTEESLSSYNHAKEKKCKIACLSSGGKLSLLAENENAFLIKIPRGYQPRCALGYSFFPLLILMHKLGFIQNKTDDIRNVSKAIKQKSILYTDLDNKDNAAIRIAGHLEGKIPILYSSADVEDIKNRVLRNIVKKRLFSKIDENSIVIARNLTPSDTILFSKRNLLGFATDLGGINSHLAIIARSMNIPAVVGMSDISSRIRPSDYLIIDGYKGKVIKNPTSETLNEYKILIKKNFAYEKTLIELEKLPSETKDGKKITLSVNLEFNKEIDYVLTHAGCGVGLYRTEHLFLEKGDFPTEEEQYKQYKMLSDRLYPNIVTVRTFDIGGDKILPESQKEANPFLGWRGIRICLEKKDIFIKQLRALLRASWKGNIRIMFPMISSLDEVKEIKKILKKIKSDLKRKKIKYDENIKIGIMVEVPSAVFIIDALAKEVDFFSIGTNDLVQYLLAVDRDSTLVSNLYQKFHPSVVKALNIIVQSALKHNIDVSICGEMAGDPFACVLLIGLGIQELSVESTSFLRIKRIIRQINYSEAVEISNNILSLNSESKIREVLAESYKMLNLI